jgi:lysophospholipase L1-like esterase
VSRALAITLALLLAVMVGLTLRRDGAFDFSRPLGMVDRPCEIRHGLTDFLRGDGERRRQWSQADLCHFQADNARLHAAGARPKVVMIGDSITEYWRQKDPTFFGPETLEDAVVSRGIAGQTSAQVLLRFEQDAVALRPRAVHILVGLNDIAGNTGLTSPAEFQANIRAMVTLAKAEGIVVVLASLPPAREFYWRKGIDPQPRVAELNRWLRRFAGEQGVAFADYHAVLADDQGRVQPRFSDDGVHPTRAAYAAMESVAEAAFAQAFGRSD